VRELTRLVALLLLSIAGCAQAPPKSTSPLPPADPQLQRLREQLDELSHRQDVVEGEQQRLHELLEQLIARAGQPPASFAELGADLEHLRQQVAADSQRNREALLALGQAFGELQRGQVSATASLEQIRQALSDLSRRPGSAATLREPLDQIAGAVTVLSHKDKASLLDRILPFLGVILGGFIALGASWWLKREDTMIKLSETYLSDDFLARYADALWLATHPGTAQDTPLARNKLLQVVGFFRFVKVLNARHRLDSELLAASGMLKNGADLSTTIRSIDTKQHPDWAGVIAQLS
jgi:hypothetical protein